MSLCKDNSFFSRKTYYQSFFSNFVAKLSNPDDCANGKLPTSQ